MIKVMIVDDEPYIRQGLKILINWEQYGFILSGEAATGKEALELMESGEYDLVITDIKMPNMGGLELIERTWEQVSKQISFIILSGYNEFEYARKAIKYSVIDYVLKPVQKEELIWALESFKDQYYKEIAERKRLEDSNKMRFDRYLSDLLLNKYDTEALEYVKRYLYDTVKLRFINIEYDSADEGFQRLSNEEKTREKNILYDSLRVYLCENWYHAYMDAAYGREAYGVGFIYVKKLGEGIGLNEKDYILRLYQKLSEALKHKIILYIGQRVEDISQISESYKSATIAHTFQLFSREMDIAYYDELVNKPRTGRYPIDKYMMDDLIKAIEENDEKGIEDRIDAVYEYLKNLATEPDIIKINLDYLLFNLICMAKDLDSDFDQGDIYKMISQGGYEKMAIRGSVKHFKEFALEFSAYLMQLRQHTFGGVLTEIEKEITEHYMDNLSLKYLSEKYYINSAYLGQIFKRQYGSSFKDYLNNYRIDRSSELLRRSDEQIYLIASAVGFNNTDYFISKFVQIKGITPLQYRKQYLTSKKSLKS